MRWNSKIRLKHVATQRYLAAEDLLEANCTEFQGTTRDFSGDEDGADESEDECDDASESDTVETSPAEAAAVPGDVPLAKRMLRMKLVLPGTASADPTTDNTLFEIVPELLVKDKLARIAVDDVVRLQHVATGRWVHAETKLEVKRTTMYGTRASSSAFENTARTAQWDKAPLIQVSLSKDRLRPDAFQMMKVPDELTYWTTTISGFLPTLHRYSEIRQQREYTSTEAAELANELEELNAFLYVHGIEQKGRQKLLRSLQTVEALIAMLKAPFMCDGADKVKSHNDVGQPRHEGTQKVLRGVFKVLRSFLKGDSRKNEMYMCAHISYLWDLFGTHLDVESMFNELVRDNIAIIKMFDEPEVQKVVDLLNHKSTGENPSYLELLSVRHLRNNLLDYFSRIFNYLPHHAHRVTYSVWCPCVLGADWCLQFDVMTHLRLQVLSSCNGRPCQRHQSTIGRLLLRAETPPVYSILWRSKPHAFRLGGARVHGRRGERSSLVEGGLPVSADDVGCKVRVDGYDEIGILRFVGLHFHEDALRCGVEFPGAIGVTNGTINGTAYFVCAENHGVFAVPERVRTYVDPKDNHIIMVSHPHHSVDKPIDAFAASAQDEDDSTSTIDYLFLQQQLELFSDLCLGRDEDNINLVTRFVSADCCLAIAMATSRFQDPGGSVRSPFLLHDEQRVDVGANLELPRSLRSRFVELMVNAFVDREGMDDIASDVVLSYEVEKLAPAHARGGFAHMAAGQDTVKEELRPKSSVTPVPFTNRTSVADILSRTTSENACALSAKLNTLNVKGWIAHELRRNGGRMIYSHEYAGMPHNKLLGSILTMLHSLIKFGFYTAAEARALMDGDAPLKSMLDGSSDRQTVSQTKNKLDGGSPSPDGHQNFDAGEIEEDGSRDGLGATDREFEAAGRYVYNATSRPVIEAKHKALLCIKAMYMVSFKLQLKYVLTDLVTATTNLERNMQDKAAGTDLGAELAHLTKGLARVVTGAVTGAIGAVSNPWGLLFSNDDDNEAVAFGKAVDRVQSFMAQHRGTEDKAIFEETKDIQAALRAVTRQFSWIHPGWDSAEKTHLEQTLSSPDSPSKHLVDVLIDLSNYQGSYHLLTKSLELIDCIYSCQGKLLTCAIQTSVACCPASCKLVKHLDETVSELRQLSRLLLCEDAAIGRISDLLDSYTTYCYVKSAVGTTRGIPNRINQQYVFNRGVLAIVIDMLSVNDRDPSVLKSCFSLMQALATRFPAAQEAIMDNLNLLLEVGNVMGSGGARTAGAQSDRPGDTWQNAMGLALAEIFTGNKGTCIRVHQEQVQRILDLMVMFTHIAPSFITALEAIAKVEDEDLSLARNQHIIMTNVIKRKKKLLTGVHIDTDHNAERRVLLQQAVDGDPKLIYHLEMVGLLASACEGENQQIESTCRSIFDLHAVLETITDPKIHENRKAPYFRFLLWAYLIVGKSSSAADLQELEQPANAHKFFAALCRFGTHLRGNILQGTNGRETGDVSALFKIFVPVVKLMLELHAPVQGDGESYTNATIACNCVSDIVGHVMAVSPVLMTPHAADRCAELLQHIISRKSPVQNRSGSWAGTLGDLDVLMQKNDLCQRSLADSVTAGQFSRTYYHECSLNLRLNELTRFVRMGFNGENTVRVQLAHLRHTATLDMVKVGKNMYAEDESEDEYIPLGPEFQSLVSLMEASISKYRQMNRTDGKASVSHDDRRAYAELSARTVGADRPTLFDNLKQLWSNALGYQAGTSAENRAENEKMISKTLQVVRAMLQNDTLLHGNSLALQNITEERKAVIPCAYLFNSHNRAIRQEALALSKGYLADGCGAVQQAFAVYILATRDEQMFSDFSTLLDITWEAKKEARTLAAAKKTMDTKRADMKKERTLRLTMTTMGGFQSGFDFTSLQASQPATIVESRQSADDFPAGSAANAPLLGTLSSSGTRKNQVAHAPLSLSDMGQTLDEFNDTPTTVRGAEAVRKLQALLEFERTVSLKRFTEDPGNVRLGTSALERPPSRRLPHNAPPPPPHTPKKTKNQKPQSAASLRCSSRLLTLLSCGCRFGFALPVLNVMQGLCEANNVMLQNYLRTQPENVTSYNLVLKTVQFLECVQDEYGAGQASNELVFQLLETLVEFVQGNPLNQKEIFDAHIIDCVNLIMRSVGLDSALDRDQPPLVLRHALGYPACLKRQMT